MVTDGVSTPSEQCVQEKIRQKLPMQMTRDVVRVQHKTFLVGKLPQWKFLSGKAIPFALQCMDLDVQKSFVGRTPGFISYVITLRPLHVLPRET